MATVKRVRRPPRSIPTGLSLLRRRLTSVDKTREAGYLDRQIQPEVSKNTTEEGKVPGCHPRQLKYIVSSRARPEFRRGPAAKAGGAGERLPGISTSLSSPSRPPPVPKDPWFLQLPARISHWVPPQPGPTRFQPGPRILEALAEQYKRDSNPGWAFDAANRADAGPAAAAAALRCHEWTRTLSAGQSTTADCGGHLHLKHEARRAGQPLIWDWNGFS